MKVYQFEKGNTNKQETIQSIKDYQENETQIEEETEMQDEDAHKSIAIAVSDVHVAEPYNNVDRNLSIESVAL